MSKKRGRTRGDVEIELQPEPNVRTDLDPHLQAQLLRTRDSQIAVPESARGGAPRAVTLDVIAKLRDPTRDVPGLNVGRRVGQLMTGTVTTDLVEAVRADPNVISLKLATRLERHLQHSVPDIRATQQQLRTHFPGLPIDGSRVIVGVVDEGCDFVHRNFRNMDGTTRILCLWDQRQNDTPSPPIGYQYGREFQREAIDSALRQAAPVGAGNQEQPSKAYDAMGYELQRAAHGTHVLDIAAGNGRGSGAAGIAAGADIIFVHVAAGDVQDDESLGNSRHLLEAVEYIFSKAAQLQLPAVVNLSLGTHGGPHDGSTLAEQWFDTLLETPGRAIVLSAGNSRDRASHAAGQLASGQRRTLNWIILEGDETENELEIWYSGTGELSATLITPGGVRLGPVALGAAPRRIIVFGELHGHISHRRDDPNNHDNQIEILLDPSLPSGTWSIELENVGATTVLFHSWIERDDQGQSQFGNDVVQSQTLGSISCGKHTIVVGSFEAEATHNLSSFSAEGTTRDGKQKPELSAPGGTKERPIFAAEALTQGTFANFGTSMAAPHVSGVIALLMQAAAPRQLAVSEIRQLLLGSAQQAPPQGPGWHPRYGVGRVDAVSVIRNLLPQAPGITESLDRVAPATRNDDSTLT